MESIQWLKDRISPMNGTERAAYLKILARIKYKPITLEPSQEDELLDGCLGGIFEVTPIIDDIVSEPIDVIARPIGISAGVHRPVSASETAATSSRKKRSSNSRICRPTAGNKLLLLVEDANGDIFQILHVSMIDPNIF